MKSVDVYFLSFLSVFAVFNDESELLLFVSIEYSFCPFPSIWKFKDNQLLLSEKTVREEWLTSNTDSKNFDKSIKQAKSRQSHLPFLLSVPEMTTFANKETTKETMEAMATALIANMAHTRRSPSKMFRRFCLQLKASRTAVRWAGLFPLESLRGVDEGIYFPWWRSASLYGGFTPPLQKFWKRSIGWVAAEVAVYCWI